MYSPFQIADEDEDIVLDAAIRLMNSCKPESNEARKDDNAVFFRLVVPMMKTFQFRNLRNVFMMFVKRNPVMK